MKAKVRLSTKKKAGLNVDALGQRWVKGESIRALAAEALGSMGAGAKSTVPALIRAARDDSELVRRYATATLGAIGPAADIAIGPLVELLVLDESEAVRDSAARSWSGHSSSSYSSSALSDPSP